MEVELHDTLTLREETLLDMHSILNVMCMITLELLKIGELTDRQQELEDLADDNATLSRLLGDPAEAKRVISRVGDFHESVRVRLLDIAKSVEVGIRPTFARHLENLENIFAVLRLRAREIQARANDPDAWVEHGSEDLRQALIQVLEAIQLNSMGAYRIVLDERMKGAGDYYVNLDIRSWRPGVITMPAVFQDVMRDLIANARKYTRPGGRILACLLETEDTLTFEVKDTGIGIPPEEIPSVVRFGVRGSNARVLKTNGGGFGLTKAAYVARKFGGKMWIESSGIPGEGTRILLKIPTPVEVSRNREASAYRSSLFNSEMLPSRKHF